MADWSIFEKNTGYTIAQLKKDGFNYDEIKQIKRKYIESIEKLQGINAITLFINREFMLNLIKITKREQNEFFELLDKRDVQGLDVSNELGKLREKMRIRQEFEEECGYTIEQLEKMGFDDTEIEKMKCKFNGQTGERIDRKKVVSNYIKDKQEKRQEFEEECGHTIFQLKTTLQEIGKSILEDFKKNPERAEKVIEDLEQGIKISKRTNDEIIQGED